MKPIYYFALTILLVLPFTLNAQTQTAQIKAIKEVLKKQETAWNTHNLEAFMQGYWKSDSLAFFGKNGMTYGWQQTLDNYKKGYPTKAHTGTLKFTIEKISELTKDAYWVMGRYYLTRTIGNAEGIFMILFKNINGHWKIVADMSCG